MRKWLFTLIILISTQSLFAQKIKSVIPYTVFGGKMIVEMAINGKSQRLIFDTGGYTSITTNLLDELGLTVTDSLNVTDVNSQNAVYKMTRLESILTGKNGINFKGFKAIIIPEPSPLICHGVEGIIGSELFVNAIVEIDHKAKTITITSAEVPSKASLRAMCPFAKSGTTPLVNVSVGKGTATILFDTGYSGFLQLKTSDYESSNLIPISEAFAEGSFGLAGQAERSISYRANLDLNFAGAKFKNIIAETSNPPYTLLGMKLLDYGKVTIDYSRGRLFFEAYEKENDVTSVVNDFSLTVKDGKLTVSTVWASLRGIVEPGDVVTHVNGKPVRENYDFCTSVTTGYPEFRAKKKTIFTVSTRAGEKKITQKNKKK